MTAPSILGALGRTMVVVIAFVIAAGCAGFIGVRLALERMTHDLHRTERGLVTVFDWALRALDLSFFTTLVLALAVVIVGEVVRIRSALYYIAGGGIAVAAAPLYIEIQKAGGPSGLPFYLWQVFATAGFTGGAIYWFIAGRRA